MSESSTRRRRVEDESNGGRVEWNWNERCLPFDSRPVRLRLTVRSLRTFDPRWLAMSEPTGSPEARRWASRMVEAAGVEPASEGASSQDSTCVSALDISLAGSKSDEKNLTASPGMSRPHTPRRHVGASPLNGASSPVEGALG